VNYVDGLQEMNKNTKNMSAKQWTIESGKKYNPRNKLLIVTPTLGIVRIEWAMARYGMAMPCNFSHAGASLGIGYSVPKNYLVADAQNLGAEDTIKKGFEWMLLLEDDVCPPVDAMLILNKYIVSEEVPVVSGLYFLKGNYSEPLLYRNMGDGPYTDFKIGDKVWVEGVPTGFLLIHSKILKLMSDESPFYETIGKRKVKKIFETPCKIREDPEIHGRTIETGTSDLNWCKRVIDEKVITRAGWPKIGKKKYPFLCDTRIFCKHIDLGSGRQYP